MSNTTSIIVERMSQDGREFVFKIGYNQVFICMETGKIRIPPDHEKTVICNKDEFRFPLDEVALEHLFDVAHTAGIGRLINMFFVDGKFKLRACCLENDALASMKIVSDWYVDECPNDPLALIVTIPGKQLTVGHMRSDKTYTDENPVPFRSLQGPMITHPRYHMMNSKKRFEHQLVK